MKRSSYMIGIAAIMLAAAFALAGVPIGEADANAEGGSHEVTFDYDGGVDSNGMGFITTSVEEGNKVIAPKVTREGCVFNGWDNDISAAISGPTTFTAQWIELFRVTFQIGEEPSEADVDIYADVDGKVNAPKNPAKDGYKFVGWYLSTDDGKAVVKFPATVEDNVRYIAYWEEVQYTLIFDSGDKQVYTKTAAEFENFVAPVPIREGYTFDGWYADDMKVFKADGTKADAEMVLDADLVLTSKFTPVNMTVTFVVGEYTTKQTVLYGECAMAPALPEGYDAWLVDGEVFDFKTPIIVNITITAQVAEVEPEPEVTVYDVTFVIEGKTPVTMKSDNITIPNTDREGYNFLMWVIKGEPNKSVNPLNYEYTEDVTFVAVYEESTPAEPGFFETPTGKCVIILGLFLAGLILYKTYPIMIAPKLAKVKKGGKKE